MLFSPLFQGTKYISPQMLLPKCCCHTILRKCCCPPIPCRHWCPMPSCHISGNMSHHMLGHIMSNVMSHIRSHGMSHVMSHIKTYFTYFCSYEPNWKTYIYVRCREGVKFNEFLVPCSRGLSISVGCLRQEDTVLLSISVWIPPSEASKLPASLTEQDQSCSMQVASCQASCQLKLASCQ